jgi:hypothetical protein
MGVTLINLLASDSTPKMESRSSENLKANLFEVPYPDNSMSLRTLSLYPTGSCSGSVKFMVLKTMKIIVLPSPRVHRNFNQQPPPSRQRSRPEIRYSRSEPRTSSSLTSRRSANRVLARRGGQMGPKMKKTSISLQSLLRLKLQSIFLQLTSLQQTCRSFLLRPSSHLLRHLGLPPNRLTHSVSRQIPTSQPPPPQPGPRPVPHDCRARGQGRRQRCRRSDQR